MATPATAFPLSKVALEGLLRLSNAAYNTLNQDWKIRDQLIDIDCAYQREGNMGQEHFSARTANRYGDKSRIQDVTVPIVMPQVEAGVTYLSRVFLSGNPIFGVVTNKAAADDVASQYDAIMEENSIRGGWVRQLNMFFRDGLKYNLCALEVNWDTKRVFSPITDPQFSATEGKPTEVIWQGNTITRRDMYNTFWDNRVPPAEVHIRGEYAGYIELVSRVELKQFIQDLDGVIKDNIKAALESGAGGSAANSYFIPQINPQAILEAADPRNRFDWAAWSTDTAKQRINYSNVYEKMVIYVRIIPSDFNMAVPGKNQPQIWKLIIINQSVIIFAERQTNAHNYLNILIGQPLEDGLNYQTKSYAANTVPLQEAASALLNASLNSKRRLQFDRLLYNPSLVRKEDINSSNPIARIPVKPSAYLKNLSDAVYAFPYNDNASQGMLQEMGLLVNFADKLQGINASQQGQFTKGNRTKHEYDDIMGNSDGRLQTLALFFEAQVFVPLKEMLKLNIMQYAPAGEIYSRETKSLIKIDPLALRTAAIEFKVSDGYLPSDKLISAETMQVALQVAGSSPQISAELDIVGLFLHYLKTQGSKDIEQFRRTPQQAAGVINQQTAAANGNAAAPVGAPQQTAPAPASK
jgi:hypothetical protein